MSGRRDGWRRLPDVIRDGARGPCRSLIKVNAACRHWVQGLPFARFLRRIDAVGDMIEVVPSLTGEAGARLRLRPPRALTSRQFVMLFVLLAGAMGLVAGLGWLAGNAFAPAFALLHCALVAAALRWSWIRGERGEEIVVEPGMVQVHRTAEAHTAFRAHPYWVWLRVEGEDERVLLASGGRQVEVGSFLGPAERRELVDRLEGLLAAAGGRNR